MNVLTYVGLGLLWLVVSVIGIVLSTLVFTAMFWLGSTVFLPMFPGM